MADDIELEKLLMTGRKKRTACIRVPHGSAWEGYEGVNDE